MSVIAGPDTDDAAEVENADEPKSGLEVQEVLETLAPLVIAPTVALIGRPNVGKSTLFNQLTRSRDALVADEAGLTRDRQYGMADVADGHCIVVDTGGIMEDAVGLDATVAMQSRLAIEEADLVLFMVDGRAGVMSEDQSIAQSLRQHASKTVLVMNKCEGRDLRMMATEFFSLGLGDPLGIAAGHGQGLASLRELISQRIPLAPNRKPRREHGRVGVALVGRPNAGKSTLLNRLVGENRVIASEIAGTTRDSVEVDFDYNGKPYALIDTAGLRRKAKVFDKIEKFSVVKTMQAIEAANVVVALIDAREGVGALDAHILGMIADSGRAIVVAINKWDGLEQEERKRIKSEIERRLPFLDYATFVTISALHGSKLTELMQAVSKAHRAAFCDLSTSALTAALEKAVHAHAPPAVAGRRIKLRYAHQGGRNPPMIVIHGNQTEKLNNNYKRYLVNAMRQAFDLHGTPVALQFKTSDNPYKDRKNSLNAGQQRKRDRMIKHRITSKKP